MNEYYQTKLEEGVAYQDFVVEKLYEVGLPIISYSSKKYQLEIGENKAGLEIKNDQKFRSTGNFYVEYAEKSDARNLSFVPSGIMRSDNTWLYLMGDYEEIFVFGKCHLVLAMKRPCFRHVEIPTSKGFLLPVDAARTTYSIKIINCLANSFVKQ